MLSLLRDDMLMLLNTAVASGFPKIIAVKLL